MEPMKRMTIAVSIIFLIAIIALVGIYFMLKKVENRMEMRGTIEEKEDSSQQEGIQQETHKFLESPHETVPMPESETSAQESSPPSEAAIEGQMASSIQQECDIISEEDIAKYLKAKEIIFPAYSKKRYMADLMLNQKKLWQPPEIRTHMIILMDMKVKKKLALEDSELTEKRFHYITNALMEWVFRTKEIKYKKKYVGDEDFYSKKINGILPCEENDQLFKKHKENILKTFMGDFELVDY